MHLLFRLACLTLALGLRLGAKSPRELWSSHPIDVVSLILHSIDLAHLTSLMHILQDPNYPLLMIYNVGCHHHLDQSRLHGLLRATKEQIEQRRLVLGVECIYNTPFVHYLDARVAVEVLPYSLFELSDPGRLYYTPIAALKASRKRDASRGIVPMTTCSWLAYNRPALLRRQDWSFRRGDWEQLMPECWEEADANLARSSSHEIVTMRMTRVLLNVRMGSKYLERCMTDAVATAPLIRHTLRTIMVAEVCR